MNCFECGGAYECDHHVIPQSLGGAKTVPLCAQCHALVHDKSKKRRDSISALTSAALQRKRARGERVGQIPYGAQLAADGVHLEPHEGEQLVIADARKLRAAGLSLRAIASELSKRGLYTRKGRTFNHTQVSRMFIDRPLQSTTSANHPTATPRAASCQPSPRTPMQFRSLLLKRAHQNDPAWLHILDTTGATIGEATRMQDGRWIVTLIDSAQAPAYGLDEERAMFSDRHHLRDWAQDVHLRSAHSTLARLSDVDLQRLRTLAAEAVSARATLRDVETYR